MKDYLKKLIQKRNARISEIRNLIVASQDVNEVRSLTTEAEGLQEEVREAQAQLDAIEAEEQRAAQAQNTEQRDDVPANARLVNGMMLALLALLAPGAANAQNRAIVTIGEGTYGQIYPLPGYYGYQYSVYLYTPSAAPALDLDCDISSIAFNVRDNSTNTGAKMYIWVKDVDADYALAETTTFSEYTEGATQVYENDDFSSTDGWNTFAFTSDFSHEGV